MKLKSLALIFTLLIPFNSNASEIYYLALNHGTPTSGQNVEVNTVDFELSSSFYELTYKTNLNWHVGVGQLYSEADDSNQASLGLGISHNLSKNLRTYAIGQVKYLEDYVFSQGYNRNKNFSGHYQYTFALAADYSISKVWKVGYRLSHMSNANMYEKNPGLDTHNLSIVYTFD